MMIARILAAALCIAAAPANAADQVTVTDGAGIVTRCSVLAKGPVERRCPAGSTLMIQYRDVTNRLADLCSGPSSGAWWIPGLTSRGWRLNTRSSPAIGECWKKTGRVVRILWRVPVYMNLPDAMTPLDVPR